MRKVILGLAVSLDGFIEGPNGEIDWCFTDEDYGMSEFFERIDAVFIGRKSYEAARKMNTGGGEMPGMPKMAEYVFSNTLDSVKGDSVLVRGSVKDEVKKIKSSKGKDIWLFGGAELTAGLMNMGLVDEIWLSVHPVLLGSGKPLFSGIKDRIVLNLLKSKTYGSGLVSLRYELDKN